jgi:putative aldouronate transport system permease protein
MTPSKSTEATAAALSLASRNSLRRRIFDNRQIYLLFLPGVLFYVFFHYVPMWMLVIAFQNYSPFQGVFKSEWVGIAHFKGLLTDPRFYILFRNTLAINLIKLVFFFPAPILLALMLNEVRHEGFKRVNQTIVYLPHFLSWVVVASMTFFLLSVDVGLVNKALVGMGLGSVTFLSNPGFFWGILTGQIIWKESGWGTIIFLAAMAGVDLDLYEAGIIDGCGRLRQIWHITLPAIRPTIVVLLVMRLGSIADVGLEQILLMMNPMVNDVANVFDTYSYMLGIQQGDVSVGTAVGLFKGLVGLVLVVLANTVVKRLGHEGIY